MKNMNRRQFNKMLGAGVVAVPLSGLVAQLPAHADDDKPMVDPEAANAIALKYMAQSDKDGKNCSGCSLYQGAAGDPSGGCPLFPGATVGAESWCSAFVPKA